MLIAKTKTEHNKNLTTNNTPPGKIFRIEGEFPRLKLKEFITAKPVSQETLKGLNSVKKKGP